MARGGHCAQEVSNGRDPIAGSSQALPETNRVSPERDAVPRSTSLNMQRGTTPSWRDVPQSAMIEQLLGALLLICLGLLLGTTWTIQAVQPKLNRQAAQRQRLNEEWATIYSIRRAQARCPRCGFPQADVGLYSGQPPIEDWPDDE
jgi:hypothetical protein